jgi:predicted component of type VI protein secretion system
MIAAAINPVATIISEDQRSEALARRLRAHLEALAALGSPITYGEAAKELQLSPPNTIRQVREALQQLMAEDASADRPFIAAIVISNWRGGAPAPDFFDCAARLGRFAGDAAGPDAEVFHALEFNAVLALWAPTSESRESE